MAIDPAEAFDPSEDIDLESVGTDFPLIVCKSEGGVFEDEDFIVGTQYGAVEILAVLDIPVINAVVDERLIPQIDLVAMGFGYVLHTEPEVGIEGAVRVTLFKSILSGTESDTPDYVPDFDV